MKTVSSPIRWPVTDTPDVFRRSLEGESEAKISLYKVVV
jgi:hypothetical protein